MSEDGEVLGVADLGPLLPPEVKRVVAMCKKIDGPIHLREFRQWKLRFEFQVLKPELYHGVKLEMWVRREPKWKRLPTRSKLLQLAVVALNGDRPKGRRDVTKAQFVNKIFECEVATVDGPVPYSVVKTLVKRVAG